MCLWCVCDVVFGVWCACDVVFGVWSVATLKRFIVTPAVCPRLFEFLTTLTFGALRKNHTVSRALEVIEKAHKTETKRTRRPRAVSNVP